MTLARKDGYGEPPARRPDFATLSEAAAPARQAQAARPICRLHADGLAQGGRYGMRLGRTRRISAATALSWILAHHAASPAAAAAATSATVGGVSADGPSDLRIGTGRASASAARVATSRSASATAAALTKAGLAFRKAPRWSTRAALSRIAPVASAGVVLCAAPPPACSFFTSPQRSGLRLPVCRSRSSLVARARTPRRRAPRYGWAASEPAP